MRKPVIFNPNGTDLRKVMYYYGLEAEDKMICPFHDDHSPSFHTNFEDGIFTCFACGVSGDAFKFVQLANDNIGGLSQLILYHAILKSDKSKDIKILRSRDSKNKKEVRNRESELELANDYYFGLKSINWEKENNEEKLYMLKRGFTSKALNMCKAKLTYTDSRYPIVFPMFDMDEFKGFVCRTTNKDVEKKRKYLYNKGFSRRDTLVGNYDNKVVVLCEGYMDRLKLSQFGLKYVAAILGWKITRQQVEKLKSKGVETIISALDTDRPGEQGTDYLRNFFNVVRFQFPKGIKDPGDLDQKKFNIAYRKTKMIMGGK